MRTFHPLSPSPSWGGPGWGYKMYHKHVPQTETFLHPGDMDLRPFFGQMKNYFLPTGQSGDILQFAVVRSQIRIEHLFRIPAPLLKLLEKIQAQGRVVSDMP